MDAAALQIAIAFIKAIKKTSKDANQRVGAELCLQMIESILRSRK